MAAAEDAAKKLAALTFADAAAAKAPQYAKRLTLFAQFKARSDAALEAARAAAAPIAITLPDGSVKAGTKWVTTPLEVAAAISKQLAGAVVVAKVNDAVWDVFRPLEEDCTLKLCTFEDPEGRDVRGARRARAHAPHAHNALCTLAPPLRRCARAHAGALPCRPFGTAARTCWARCWSCPSGAT
jgi:hypothetical protein